MALLAFGADSGIELASAFVVFLRFKKHAYLSETVAARITGILLFVLAVFFVVSSIVALINPRFWPQPTYLGIALLIAAAVGMPWLAHQKRSLATKAGSGSLKADAAQSSMCAYLAWIALAGLLLNAIFTFSWADPVAAFAPPVNHLPRRLECHARKILPRLRLLRGLNLFRNFAVASDT